MVEVDSLTTVTVDAPLYDSTLSAAGGCDPAGCTGDKTRVSSSEGGTRFVVLFVD